MKPILKWDSGRPGCREALWCGSEGQRTFSIRWKRAETRFRCTGAIVQDVMLYPDSPVVHFKTHCRWQEKLRMLRADFAPAVWSD